MRDESESIKVVAFYNATQETSVPQAVRHVARELVRNTLSHNRFGGSVMGIKDGVKAINDALPEHFKRDWIVVALRNDSGGGGAIILTTKNGTLDGAGPTILEVVKYSR